MSIEVNTKSKRVLVLQSRAKGSGSDWRDCELFNSYAALNQGVSTGRYDVAGMRYRVMVRTIITVDDYILDSEYCWEGSTK